MNIKPGIRDFLWMAAGAVVFSAIALIVVHFQTGQSPSDQLAFKARRVDLASGMRMSLASASEAEKSAVLAITDQDSQIYADQARTATADVEQKRRELEVLLTQGGTQREKDLLAQFFPMFSDLQRIDKDLLDLAVRNTNLKASSLAFGPAADALKEMDAPLLRLVTKSASSPDARNVALLAYGTQIAALQIQTLLAPHIAEESDAKMDAMEALMTKQDQLVHKDLEDLAALPDLHGDPDLAAAVAGYAKFSEIRGRILALSRENTNVRSLAISLGQKRKMLFLCQDALSALQQSILEEPIAGVDYGYPPAPRQLGTEESGKGK